MEVPVPPRNQFCPRCNRRTKVGGWALCQRCLEDNELLKEDVTECPAFLDADDFKRFMRKLAVHAHTKRPDPAHKVTLDHMEMSLTEAVVEALPLFYVSRIEYDSTRRQQTGAKGSYTLKAKLPQTILYGTVEKLGLWTRQDPEECDEGGLADA